jgi:hypothetical protein
LGVDGDPEGEHWLCAAAACAWTELKAAALPFWGMTTVVQQTPTLPHSSAEVTTIK